MPPTRLAAMRAQRRIQKKTRGAPRKAEDKEHADMRREIERLKSTLDERSRALKLVAELLARVAKAAENATSPDVLFDVIELGCDIMRTSDAAGNVPVMTSDMVERYLEREDE